MHRHNRVQAGALPAPEEDLLVVELLEVALDRRPAVGQWPLLPDVPVVPIIAVVAVVPVLEPGAELELASAVGTAPVDGLVDEEVCGSESPGGVGVADPPACPVELRVEPSPGVVDVGVLVPDVDAVVEVSPAVVLPDADPVPDVPRVAPPVGERSAGELALGLGSVTESAEAGMCGGVAVCGRPAGGALGCGGEDASTRGAGRCCTIADGELGAGLAAGVGAGAGALGRWNFAAGLTWWRA